jgi:hypothetical protein
MNFANENTALEEEKGREKLLGTDWELYRLIQHFLMATAH